MAHLLKNVEVILTKFEGCKIIDSGNIKHNVEVSLYAFYIFYSL